MQQFIIDNEASLRLGIFLGVLLCMAIWEVLAPRRALSVSKSVRWANNLGLVVLNTFVLRLLFPAAAAGFALFAEHHGLGLLPLLGLSEWLTILLALVVLDFSIWLQHVIVHSIPLLWRLHRVHHADPDYDITTGLRFHTIEIIFSMGVKFIVIVLLGPPVVAVILFEVILSGMAIFNHANISLPAWLDRPLRWLVVTPDMHRVHHSVVEQETNSNFGFNLSCWDRLFGTYKQAPDAGHDGMTIGLYGLTEARQITWLPGLLDLPFRAERGDYALNRRDRDRPPS